MTLSLSKEEIALLRKIAERADADGRQWLWRSSEREGSGGYPQQIYREGDAVLVAETYEDPDHTADLADFIATFDPPTVLTLLDGYRRRHTLTSEDWAA